jgi:hypothetical protein
MASITVLGFGHEVAALSKYMVVIHIPAGNSIRGK